MNLLAFPDRLSRWYFGLAPYKQILLGIAVTAFLVEVAFRMLARRSKAYARWTAGLEAVGAFWTAIILAVIYLVSVGPISLGMRLMGRDLLDRKIRPQSSSWRTHQPNPLGEQAAARHQF